MFTCLQNTGVDVYKRQIYMYIEYKRARFIRNEGRRFKCWIEIDGKEELCYVASSSKLNHYLDIEDKEILVIENKSSQRKLKYRLFAVRANEEWIVLDLLLLNDVYKRQHERYARQRVLRTNVATTV